eukprot:10181374-Alexandrium_andersonii.AAC.1
MLEPCPCRRGLSVRRARVEVHRRASRPAGPSPPQAWSCAPLRAVALRLPCAETARGHVPLAA